MRVYITAYPLLVERAPVTLIADVDTKEDAFDLAQRQWSDDIVRTRIQEVVDEGLPRIWSLTYKGGTPRIERMPNDYCDVGYHLVAPLINGDVSGLDADDEYKLERFIEDYPNCVFTPDENEDGVIEENICVCDVTGLMNQCVTIKVFAQ
jgi:hypothetical protein